MTNTNETIIMRENLKGDGKMNEVLKFHKKEKPVREWSGEEWKRMWEGFRDKVAPELSKTSGISCEDLAWRFLAEFVRAAMMEEANGG